MAVDNFIEEHPPWQRLLKNISNVTVEIEALTVTENGTYSEEGKAYSPVTVNVSGGGETEYAVHCATLDSDTGTVTEISNCAYKGVYSSENASYVPDTTTGLITEAKPGEIVVLSSDGTYANINPVVIVGDSSVLSDLDSSQLYLAVDGGFVGWCPMPSSDAWFVTVSSQ